jgi:hypothetical protein
MASWQLALRLGDGGTTHVENAAGSGGLATIRPGKFPLVIPRAGEVGAVGKRKTHCSSKMTSSLLTGRQLPLTP